MIYCCGKYLEPDRVIFPDDNWARTNQRVEIVYCNRHKGLVAELTYFDTQKKEFKKYRPKREKTQQFLEKIKKTVFFKKIKTGTKSNQAFKYGLNLIKKDKIHQYAVDFNGEKTLILIKELT